MQRCAIYQKGYTGINDGMMRILLITSVDITTKSGGGFANRAFYDSLTTHFPDSVDVISMSQATMFEKVASALRVRIHRLHSRVLNALDRRPGEYQLCVINSGLYGDLVPAIKKRCILVVTIHHNVEAVFQMDNKRPVTLWGLTPYLVKKNERKAYQSSDLNLFLSDDDRKKMSAFYATTRLQHDVVVGVYETIAQSKVPLQAMTVPAHQIDLAMSGCLNHLQTRLGMKDFMTHYDNLLKKLLPADARLVITGRNPGRSLMEYARRNYVDLIPNPESISEAIKGCSLYLCPVNVGSGVKLRILDGLRLGMPVLAHQVSARGYEVFAVKPWFKAYDDVASFEKGLQSTLTYMKNHPNFKAEIIDAYKAHFSFEAGDQRFIEALMSILP